MTAVNAMQDEERPASANEALAGVNEEHTWVKDPEDLNSTPGLQKAIRENRDAIQALADYIDGKDGKPRSANGAVNESNQRAAEQARVEQQKRDTKAEWKAGTPPGPNGPDDFGNSKVTKQTPANTGQKPAG